MLVEISILSLFVRSNPLRRLYAMRICYVPVFQFLSVSFSILASHFVALPLYYYDISEIKSIKI